MLSWFRNNAKIFLIAIVVIFVGMIFLQWGRGGLDNVTADRLDMGSVNGERLEPSWYDAARQEVYATMENQMVNMGYPNSETQLALMYNDINEAAFELMVDRTLQDEYLRSLGWEPVSYSMAEELLAAQLLIMGIQDPRGYMNEYRNDPNYAATLMQVVSSADRSLFNSAVNLESMISMEELDFMIQDAMTGVTARYLSFRAAPEMPGEEELLEFYETNRDLFTREPGSRIRFVTFMVQPGEEDLEFSMSFVDSLALAGAGDPDTMLITREQLEAIAGWNIDMAPGDISRPFTAVSMNQPGLQACHAIELLAVQASDDTSGAGDTLSIVHWEVPLFPGRNTVRQAFWDIEEKQEEILSSELPAYNEYQIVDFGEMIIDLSTEPSAEMPQSLISFATDSVWADSIGPVFYLPSYAGGYPALMVARKLEAFQGGQIEFEEAAASNMLLVEYYSRIQEEASLMEASNALEYITSTGMGLQEYAEAESLEVYETQQFNPATVRQWAESDEAAYRGILGSAEFADASLSSPEFTVIGPFVSGGVAYLAEITSRTAAQVPDDPAQLAGFYLSMESGYSSRYSERLMAGLRSSAEIVDGRLEYYTTMDSLRAEYAARQAEQEAEN